MFTSLSVLERDDKISINLMSVYVSWSQDVVSLVLHKGWTQGETVSLYLSVQKYSVFSPNIKINVKQSIFLFLGEVM